MPFRTFVYQRHLHYGRAAPAKSKKHLAKSFVECELSKKHMTYRAAPVKTLCRLFFIGHPACRVPSLTLNKQFLKIYKKKLLSDFGPCRAVGLAASTVPGREHCFLGHASSTAPLATATAPLGACRRCRAGAAAATSRPSHRGATAPRPP